MADALSFSLKFGFSLWLNLGFFVDSKLRKDLESEKNNISSLFSLFQSIPFCVQYNKRNSIFSPLCCLFKSFLAANGIRR